MDSNNSWLDKRLISGDPNIISVDMPIVDDSWNIPDNKHFH